MQSASPLQTSAGVQARTGTGTQDFITVEDVLKKFKEFDKYFKKNPDRYIYYLKLLFKAGRFVIKALIEEESLKNPTVEHENDTLHKVQGSSQNESDISALDITSLASRYLSPLTENKIESKLIKTIIDLRNSYDEAVLISPKSYEFNSRYLNPLKFSIDQLALKLNQENQEKYDKILQECRTRTKDSDSYLDELKNQGINIKNIKDIFEDWKTCVKTLNVRMDEHLLSKPDDLPSKETLNKFCAAFGRKSDVSFKVCKKVCSSIKESNPHIIDVYASRKAEVLGHNGEKEEEFEIKFVVITENLNEKRRKELEISIQQDYDTLPIRDRYQLSGEETELRKEGRHELKGEDLNRVKTCMRLNAHTLLERHTYLTIISGSPIKSVGYDTSNHRIEETPCIVLSVPYKGYIPIDEDPFQKSYDGVLTDVREDIFVLFTGTAKERHDPLKTGCQISGERADSGNYWKGTLGGFVVHPDYGQCGISCGHVLLSPTELEQLSEKNEINWERPSILAGKNDTTCEKNVFQPEISQIKNNQIGRLVKVLYKSGKPDSLEMDAYGMDVALFQLNQRLPKSGAFPAIQVASEDISSDENDNNSPVYKEVPQQFGKGAVAGFAWLEGKGFSKFGATTGYTTGEMSINCPTSVKVPLDWTHEDGPNKFRFILHNQVSIVNGNTGIDDIIPINRPPDSTGWFGYHGDSGALVYHITPDGNLVCVGMVVGGTFATKHCIVTPILPVLKEMGITSFKDFDSEQLEVNVRTLVQDMEVVTHSMRNVQQSMVNVEHNMGYAQQRMETRMDSIETNMGNVQQRMETNMANGFANIMAQLNQMQNH